MVLMRRASLSVPLLLVACSSVDPAPNVGGSSAPVVAAQSAIPRSEVERDLALELTRTSTEALDHERDPDLEVWLVNRSTTASYPVVLANDGSEMGWREPHAFFTVERLGSSGAWEPAPEGRVLRCGNYASNWEQDVVTLAPGGRVKMPWMPYPARDLGDTSKVRITARYEYGAQSRDKSKVPPALHAMPEYAITSKPIEMAIEHPYALEVKVKGALPTTAQAPIASAIDVVVENRSQRTLPVGTSETGAQLWFEVRVAGASTEPVDSLFLDTTPTYASKETLAAGARTSIVTAATRTDVIWSLPNSKIVQIRALWRIWDEKGGRSHVRRVESPWVDVR